MNQERFAEQMWKALLKELYEGKSFPHLKEKKRFKSCRFQTRGFLFV
jgi:hypothetical protein